MFDKLNQVAARYAQISESLMNPEIVSDQEQYKKLMKEHKQLSPLVEKYQEYDRAKADAAEAHELLEGGGLDKDFREMVEEELTASRKRMEELAEELRQDEGPKLALGDGGRLCCDYLTSHGIACRLAPENGLYQSAVGVALAAEDMARRGETVSGRDLVPTYLRLSQAERERLAKGLKITAE